jgi:hypothetical protein
MSVETLGEALSYGWRITARCAWGKQREGLKTPKECRYRAELDLETLVWTRGRTFPISRLESRLRCPHCGSREVTLIFSLPTNANVESARARVAMKEMIKKSRLTRRRRPRRSSPGDI